MKPRLPILILCLLFIQPIFSQNTLDLAGLSASTPPSVAYSFRKLSSNYSGFALKARRASDNAEANVAFDVTGGISATSLATFTPGVAIGTALGTSQAGTISTAVSKTGSISISVNKTGTITTINTSLTINGTGTSFTADLAAGDRIFNAVNNVLIGVVASVTSNTSLQLTNFATASLTSVGYKTTNAIVTGIGTIFTTELAAGDRLFNSANTYLGTIAAIINSTILTLNAVDVISASAISYKSTSATITGIGTLFTTLLPGDLLISNNITLGVISSINSNTSLLLTTKAGTAISDLAYKSTAGTISFSAFYSSSSVFINTWYDQSGNSRNAIQLKPTNQARVVNAGVLYTMGGKASAEFSGSLTSFLQTSTVASYLNNTPYTLNKVTAEATINPANQFPFSTTGGGGPANSLMHFGYRSSTLLTIAQLSHDHNFTASPGTSLEIHTGVKTTAAASQFYKNGINLGGVSSGAASYLSDVGLLNIGCYIPTGSYYNGSISEAIIFPSALNSADVTLLINNQTANYSISTVSWTGAVSTSWNDAGNWSNGIVPTISSPPVVLIPAGRPFYPVISTGTVQVNSVSVDPGASLTVNGTGIFQLTGTIHNLGTCNFSSGTIEYIGLASQGIGPNTFTGSVLNLIVNNSTGVLLQSNVTVSGNLTFTAGKLSINANTLTIGGMVTNSITGGIKGENNSNIIVNGSVSPTLSFDQTTPGGTNLLRNLTINSSGQVVTLANNLVMMGSGATTFIAGKLSIGSSTLTIKGNVVNTVNEGLRGGVSSNVTVDGILSPVLSFDQTTSGTSNALNNLTLNCTGQTVTLNRPLVITTVLNLTAGTLADAGNQVISAGTINLSSGIFKLGSATVATIWPGFTANNITTGGTVEYASGMAQIVSAVPVYQNLTISAAGGTTAANNLSINGILNLSAANPSAVIGSLSTGIYTLTMGASATTAGQGDVTGIVRRTTILPNVIYSMGSQYSVISFPTVGTLPSQISMKISIGAAPSWRSGAIQRIYDFIQTGGSGTKAVIAARYLDAELNGNIEGNLVDFSNRFTGPVLTEHGKSNFNTTQNFVSLANVDIAFFSSAFGNVELTLDESTLTTLTWNGSTGTSWITATNWTPNGGPSTTTNLIIPDASTTLNDPSLPATASNGSLTIETGGIVNSDAGAQLSLNNAGLAWSNNGTFNAGTSIITFTNANATINGATSFNDVVIATGASLLMTSATIMRLKTITNNGTWSTGFLTNTVEYNGNNQSINIPNGSTQSYSSLIISGTGTSVLPAGSLNVRGNLTINGAISSTGNTIVMNGSTAQTVNGSSPVSLNNLTINNTAAAVSLTQNLTVANTLTITSGKLAIGSNSLTLTGSVINTVLNGITGSTGSSLVVNGTTSPTLSFDQSIPGQTNALNSFLINSSGQVASLGGDLEVNGTLTFLAGKLAINSNTLTLKNSVVNSTAGGLRGSGSSNLIISGGIINPALSFDQTTAGSTNLLNNFSINSKGRSALLNNPLIIGGALTLTDGFVTTTNANSLTLVTTASVTGGGDSSYIDGPMIRNTNSTNPVFYPVGKSNIYRPVGITPATDLPGTYTAQYFLAIPPAGTYSPQITSIASNEYWDINKTSGPDASVTLIYTGANTWAIGNPTALDIIFAAHNDPGNWTHVYGTTIPGNTGSGMTTVTSLPLSSFSPFTFGFGANSVLPVTLLEFQAARAGQDIMLNWTTADELNLSSYQLDRSGDGQYFQTIGSVPSENATFVKTYNWLDQSPLQSINYYRLKMIDIDGAFKYSRTIRLDMKAIKSISIYPNPVTDGILMIQMYGQLKGEHTINIYSSGGVKVISRKIAHLGNDEIRSFAIDKKIRQGVYYMEIIDPVMRKTMLKIIIK
ncbi:MAG: hypothetical protein ABWZ25_19510 [Chitinophagaceae bacterium]